LARPTKWRRVEFIPDIHYFAPHANEDGKVFLENILRIEELEAIRLKDLNGMEQDMCAKSMEVSRQTFQRILGNARVKIADSLINGKAIKIMGGNYTRNICGIKCLDCGRRWSESYENFIKYANKGYTCPYCGSKNVDCIRNEHKGFCRHNCKRHGYR
jgi:uncharacterized protein